MSEWRDIKFAPRDGTPILAEVSYIIDDRFWLCEILYNKERDGWESVFLIHDEIEKIGRWTELPKPPKKLHECYSHDKQVICTGTALGELFLHVRGVPQMRRVNFCPYCGKSGGENT